MGKKEFLNFEIEPNSKTAPTSYKIVVNPDDACDIIRSVYEIQKVALFEQKFEKAVDGNGDERKKILTLHSSSRLALLTFYNVDDDHVLTLNIEDKDIDFNLSTFEFKNPVIGYPSNMDVVLVSTDRKTVLFLESKFSEYYMSVAVSGAPISVQYAMNEYSKFFYEKDWLESVGIGTTYESDDKAQKEFSLFTLDESVNYLDGFKQMISHYVGIRRRIKERRHIASDLKPKNKEISDIILEAVENLESKVYLGEILFDKFYRPVGCETELDPEIVFKNYTRLYSQLADKMNEINNDIDGLGQKFVVLKKDLRYSEVMRQHQYLEPMTMHFYGEAGK